MMWVGSDLVGWLAGWLKITQPACLLYFDRVMDPQQPIDDEQRFQIELEFVQCLANPWYLNRMLGERVLQNKERVDSLCGMHRLGTTAIFQG